MTERPRLVCVGGGGERSCQKRQGTCDHYITSIAKLHITLCITGSKNNNIIITISPKEILYSTLCR